MIILGLSAKVLIEKASNPVNISKSHPVVDIEHWCKLFPIEVFEKKEGPRHFDSTESGDSLDLWKAQGCFLNGPKDVACIEQVRRRVRGKHSLGRAVPVDIFIWAKGSARYPYLTKVGGVPYREADLPWPKDKNGKPYTFVAQWCFLDSRDIVSSRLGGDILLMFFRDAESYFDDDGVYFEWSVEKLQKPMSMRDVPPASFPVPEMAGQIWRTEEYPDAIDIFEKEGHYEPWLFATTQSTKIGRTTWYIQQDPTKPGEELLCTFNSFQLADTWPFVNIADLKAMTEKQRELSEIMLGDVGTLYVLIDQRGHVRYVADCY